MWPFEKGRIYNRRTDIHARYKGQERGGIITPRAHPLVIAITGEAGAAHGYADQLRPDGVFEYYGEGQIGAMKMEKGNLAIATHSSRGKSLLLFQKVARDGSLRFMGEWVCEACETRQAPDSEGVMRDAFVFMLRPLDNVVAELEQAPEHSTGAAPIPELRRLAIAAAGIAPIGTTVRNVYFRSRAIRDYVLARAAGHCEGCGAPAPFNRPGGAPYLEPHHTRRVSDGGPDDPRHVIALCPNCHRRVHLGEDGPSYNGLLEQRLTAIEAP